MLAATYAKMRAVRATRLLRYCAAADVLFNGPLITGKCSGGFYCLRLFTYDWRPGAHAPRGQTEMRIPTRRVVAIPSVILLSRL